MRPTVVLFSLRISFEIVQSTDEIPAPARSAAAGRRLARNPWLSLFSNGSAQVQTNSYCISLTAWSSVKANRSQGTEYSTRSIESRFFEYCLAWAWCLRPYTTLFIFISGGKFWPEVASQFEASSWILFCAIPLLWQWNFYSKKNFSSVYFSRKTNIRLNDRNLLLETGRAFAEFVRRFTCKVCYDVSVMAIYKIQGWIWSRNRNSWKSKWRMNHMAYFRPRVDL